MAAEKEKKRITLTANKMPDKVYEKLEKLGSDRKLTPYIVELIQKEETMDKLISSLSMLIDKVGSLEKTVLDLNHKLEHTEMRVHRSEPVEKQEPEIIKQGELNISDEIGGGIEEEIPDFDF